MMTGDALFSWLVSLVNFFVLMLVLTKAVIEPLKKVAKDRAQAVEDRQKEIDSVLEDARATHEHYSGLVAKMKDEIASIQQEEKSYREKAVADLEKKAVDEKAAILHQAELDAKMIGETALSEIQVMLTKKVVSKTRARFADGLSEEDHSALFSAGIDKVGALHVN